jgi:hypothetical protein
MNRPAPVLIGLTSIRGRERALERTLDSLLAQTLPADGRPVELHLFLSRQSYLLDRGFPRLPPGLKRRLIRSRLRPGLRLTLRWVANTGPYRKLLPLIEGLSAEQRACDPWLITADDDTLYPRDWLIRLLAAQERHDCVVAFRGRLMAVAEGAILPYRGWQVAGPELLEPSLLTVPTGKDGICYRLSQLDSRVLDHGTALRIAGHADDLWFKVHTLLTATPAVLLHDSLALEFPELDGQGRPVGRATGRRHHTPTLYLSVNKHGGNDAVLRRCLAYAAEQAGADVPLALLTPWP